MTDKIQLEHVVVDFVGVLIKAAESVNVVIAAVRDGGIDQARRPLTHRPCDLWAIPVGGWPRLGWGIWHDVGVV